MIEHPIVPPLELAENWLAESFSDCIDEHLFATRAAQWGADQELEACCALMELSDINARDFLHSARRPKPPSLKQQALDELTEWEKIMDIAPDNPIRRALEQLDD